MAKKATTGDNRRRLNLALQGGGAHGAFTWGVLDRLLEDGRFDIDGISGTSAGAMNAVCLADGYHTGGAPAAREKLGEFWRAIGRSSQFSPVQRTPVDDWFGDWGLDASPGLAVLDIFSRVLSPYDINPLDINPLRRIVDEHVDFANVNACSAVHLFIAATNVWNGKVRVFTNAEIGCDSVMASSCLPYLFKAVEIDGVPYWDGGYMGNPVLFPFFYSTATEDILLVQINPIERVETPKTAREIADRINEITFNASLIREFRAIEFVSRLIEEGLLPEEKYRKIRMHRIAVPHELVKLSSSSKLNAEPAFLDHLRDMGREAADDWLGVESHKVGVEPGIDLRDEFAYGLSGELAAELPDDARAEIARGKSRPPKKLKG